MIALDGSIAAFLAVFARTAAWTATAPLISDHTVPRRVRGAIAVAIAFAIAWVRPPLPAEDLFLALPFEILFGLTTGFIARMVIAGAEAGGQLIGIQLGLGFAGTFDPGSQDDSLPTRRIAYCFAALTFAAAGGVESSIRALASAPFFFRFEPEALIGLAHRGGDVMVAAVRFAAPVLLAGLVANLAAGAASRAAPALNIFSVMLALFLVVGFLVLFGTAPAFVRELELTASSAQNAVEGWVHP